MAGLICDRQLRLEIGGIAVSVKALDDITFGIDEEQGYFLGGSRPDMELGLRYFDAAPSIPAPGEKIFDSGGIWDLCRRGDGLAFNCYFDDLGRVPFRTAVVDRSFSSGEIYLHRPASSGGPHYPLVYPLDELLVMHILSRGKGIMVHGCGLVIRGDGYLFMGPSGRGKSTISRIFKDSVGAAILNDDRIIIRREATGRGYRIYGTPWHGDVSECSSGTAPLKRIFFIRHAEENREAPLASSEAAARLVACSFSPLWDGEGMKNVLEFASSVAEAVSASDLGFLPDKSIAEFLRFA